MKHRIKILVKCIYVFFKVARNNASIGFLSRYILLQFLYLTVNVVGEKIYKSTYIPLIVKLKKPFLFNTSFGIFVWSSFDARWRMYNWYEPIVRKYIAQNAIKNNSLKDGLYCINIWANQGRWAIELAKKFNYNVIAFEPIPSIYDELVANIFLSKLSHKVTANNYAIWNIDWSTHLKFVAEHEWMSYVIKDAAQQNEWVFELPVKKFDSLNLNIDPKCIKLMLIDVEWHEYDVLQWMEQNLRLFDDIDIIVEIFEDDPKREDLCNFMKNLWYTYSKIDTTEYLFNKSLLSSS